MSFYRVVDFGLVEHVTGMNDLNCLKGGHGTPDNLLIPSQAPISCSILPLVFRSEDGGLTMHLYSGSVKRRELESRSQRKIQFSPVTYFTRNSEKVLF